MDIRRFLSPPKIDKRVDDVVASAVDSSVPPAEPVADVVDPTPLPRLIEDLSAEIADVSEKALTFRRNLRQRLVGNETFVRYADYADGTVATIDSHGIPSTPISVRPAVLDSMELDVLEGVADIGAPFYRDVIRVENDLKLLNHTIDYVWRRYLDSPMFHDIEPNRLVRWAYDLDRSVVKLHSAYLKSLDEISIPQLGRCFVENLVRDSVGMYGVPKFQKAFVSGEKLVKNLRLMTSLTTVDTTEAWRLTQGHIGRVADTTVDRVAYRLTSLTAIGIFGSVVPQIEDAMSSILPETTECPEYNRFIGRLTGTVNRHLGRLEAYFVDREKYFDEVLAHRERLLDIALESSRTKQYGIALNSLQSLLGGLQSGLTNNVSAFDTALDEIEASVQRWLKG